jgi:hypothetical protein
MNILVIAGVVTFVIGIALLSAAAWYYRRKRAEYRNAITATGTVVAMRQQSSGTIVDTDTDGDMLFREEENMHRGVVHAPVIEFESRDGRTITITGNGANPPKYRPGDSIALIYPAAAPEKAVVDAFFDKWAILIILLVFGAMLTLFGVLTFLLS